MNIQEFVKSKLKRTGLRYIISGVASVVIEYISFLILIIFSSLFIANSVSFIIGIVAGFVFHKLWSFSGSHQLKTHYQVFAYTGIAVFNFIATNILISFFVNSMHIVAAVSKLLTMAIVAAWTYALFNIVVFRRQD